MNDVAGSFDPSAFLNATTTEANTRRPPLPAGSEFPATVGEVKIVQTPGKKDPTKTFTIAEFPLVLDLTPGGSALIESQGTNTVTLDGQIFIDLTPGGSFDMSPGKNGQLRRYREALNMNQPGQPFSLLAMQGRLLKVKIRHESYNGEIYDRVDSVSRL